jgi:hypothetical protein
VALGLILDFLFRPVVWGVPGALMAVALMAIRKIFSERIEGLEPLATVLEE